MEELINSINEVFELWPTRSKIIVYNVEGNIYSLLLWKQPLFTCDSFAGVALLRRWEHLGIIKPGIGYGCWYINKKLFKEVILNE